MIKLNDEEYDALQTRLEQFPKTGHGGMRKIGQDLAIRTVYIGDTKQQSFWGVTVYYLDTKSGARWMKAQPQSRPHKLGIAWVNAYLKMWELQRLVDGAA